MYWTLAYKPGGQPIGGLERAAAKVRKAIGRLLQFGRAAPAS
jgi:lipopolysaccharide export system permease protein